MTGEGGIRTPGTASGSTVFKTASFDHSDTSPRSTSWTRQQAVTLRLGPAAEQAGGYTILIGPGFVNKSTRGERFQERIFRISSSLSRSSAE